MTALPICRRRGGRGRKNRDHSFAGGRGQQSGGQQQAGQQVPTIHQHQLQHRAVDVRGQHLGRVRRRAGAAAGAAGQTEAAGRAEGAAGEFRQLARQSALGHHRGRARLAARTANHVPLAESCHLAGQLDDSAQQRRQTPRPGRRLRGAR